MATYETRLRETARFEAIDAGGRSCTIVEHRASLHRVSLRARPFEPIDGGHRYSLIDGRELLRRATACFETVDGALRLFAIEPPDNDSADVRIGMSCSVRPSPAKDAKRQSE